MRISGYGTKSSRTDKDERKARSERVREFRAGHVVGDLVGGVLLGWKRPGLARVNIEGREMLAESGSNHIPGRLLRFRVERLHPNIELKEVGDIFHGEEAAAALIHNWSAERDYFDALYGAPAERRDHATDTESGQSAVTRRKASFFKNVAANPELLAAWLRLLEVLRGLGSDVDTTLLGTFSFAPWLLPGAYEQELFVPYEPDAFFMAGCDVQGPLEAVFGFRLPKMGRCRVFLTQENRCLFLAHPEFGPAVEAAAQGLSSRPLLEVRELPDGGGSGLLADLLGLAELPRYGGLSIRV